jgi:hypothetical protein
VAGEVMRKVLLLFLLVLVAFAGVVVISSISSSPASRKVTMTFLCFTQDLVGFRPDQYQAPYNGSNNMAVFLLAKHGKDNYGYVVRSIELKHPEGWVRVELRKIPQRTAGWRAATRKLLYRAGLLNPTNFTRFEIVSGEVPP